MTETQSFALRRLTMFSPSPTNPRTRMSEAEIDRLADSIEQHELMQPIVARPWPGRLLGETPLEIVAGHRRWRACCKLAEAGRNPHGDSIPSLVRELTDAQVLAMQLVENIQREDLHPLEEAEHYRRMRDDASAPASVEDIAHVGKVSASRVYERLSLLQLVPAAREAFLADKLTLKTALQVARMPAALQGEVTTHLSDWGGEPMGAKAAAAFIRDRYMLRLVQAPFDAADATLLPEAGPCGTCPKRTGANPQLFGDITDADTCTDPTCFAAKKAAQRDRLVDELRVSGYTVLVGDQARDACAADGRTLKPGLHSLDAFVPTALGDPALKVSDVLQRAEAPNEHTCVIDHPSNPVVTYAVGTAVLEQHLRKIKAHRAQIDKAAQRATAPAPKPSTTAPAPGAAQSVSSSAAPAVAGQPDAGASADTDHDQLVQQLLAFKPAVLTAGKYHGRLSPLDYEREQVARATGILAAAEVAKVMQQDRAEGLPSFKLAQMLCVLLWWGESYLKLEELGQLCNVPVPEKYHAMAGRNPGDDTQHLWDLTDDQAERLAMAWLAAQEASDGTPVIGKFAESVCLGLDIAPAGIISTAQGFVRETLQLAALESPPAPPSKKALKAAAAKPKAGTTAAARYRCNETGSTWSGRGLQPKWLKVALEQGRKLAEFDTASDLFAGKAAP